MRPAVVLEGPYKARKPRHLFTAGLIMFAAFLAVFLGFV